MAGGSGRTAWPLVHALLEVVPPTADTTQLDAVAARLQAKEILTSADADAVHRLRLRAADVALQLPNLLLDSGTVHDLDRPA